MSEFIPSIPLTEFHKLLNKPNAQELLKRLKSYEITFNGEYLFTFVNGMLEPSGYLRTQTEYKCQVANAVGGETLEEVLEKTLAAV